MSVADQIAETQRRARTNLDPAVYDYFAGGSGAETSLAEAASAWHRFRLRPRVLRDVTSTDTAVELFGSRYVSPVGVAPFAFQQLLHESGEVAAARGAAGHVFVLSTRSDREIEDVAGAAGPWWFQTYVTADGSVSDRLAERAAAAGADALVLTGDTPYVGRKARTGRVRPVDPALEQSPAVTFADIGRLGALSGLPVLVKGVLRADDAQRALDAGAAGVVVSNHGGRQLDRAVASADALSEVVEVAGDAPVLVDGGIRGGLDALTALALGARAVLLGRPVAWALADAGADGVSALLQSFDEEFRHVLGLAGCRSCTDVDRDLVHPG